MASAAEVVGNVERHLRAIYDLDGIDASAALLVGDAELAALSEAGVAGMEQARGEHVFLVEHEGGLEIALYLGDEVQRALVEAPDLQSHCHAVEGVSHVLRLLWAAREGREQRLLDLELQAEVDKAATCLLLDHEAGSRGGDALLRRIFDGASLNAGPVDEVARYRWAHQMGARYARVLQRRLDRSVDEFLRELRRFYRLPYEGRRAVVAA